MLVHSSELFQCNMAFTFQFIVLYLVDFPSNWCAFVCLFGMLLSVLFIWLFFFWKLVNGALYAHICAGSVRICAIDSNRREGKKSQRFYNTFTLYLLLFLYLYKRDDALNVLLLDKNETFCLLILI